MTTLTRAETIKRIRTALRARSGKTWSVRGGAGTAYGWIRITRRPADTMTTEEQTELARLLGKEAVHHQGERIPAGLDYYQEYIDRAEGRTPTVQGRPYWD